MLQFILRQNFGIKGDIFEMEHVPSWMVNNASEWCYHRVLVVGVDVLPALRVDVWKTPGFLAGNEVPNYTDNSGSLSRRLVVWSFMTKIDKNKEFPTNL